MDDTVNSVVTGEGNALRTMTLDGFRRDSLVQAGKKMSEVINLLRDTQTILNNVSGSTRLSSWDDTCANKVRVEADRMTDAMIKVARIRNRIAKINIRW